VAQLCRIARPTIGIVTRVALAHTEMFGTIEEVARAKGELPEALPADGTAVLCADDERVAAMASRTSARVLTYGDQGDVRAIWVELDDELRSTFTITSPWGAAVVDLRVRGRHQVENALAAAAAALACGLTPDEVAAGLGHRVAVAVAHGADHGPVRGPRAQRRLQREPRRRCGRPWSRWPPCRLCAAPRSFGVMAELGERSDEEHAAMAALARTLGIRTIAVAAPAYGADEDVLDGDARTRGPR